MDEWIIILLPFLLLVARVLSFFIVLPLFGWDMVPMPIRLAIGLLMTIFLGYIIPTPRLDVAELNWLGATLLLSQEVLCGLGLGLVARLIFSAVQQGVLMGTQQMGFADAGIIDPSTGESARPIAMLFQMVFVVLFLSIDGHHLFLATIFHSYEAFPIAGPPNPAALAEGVIGAGSMMLIFALKMAAPLLAGFLLLAVVLGVIARVMPEMNILLASLPLRVAVGLFLSMMLMGTINTMVYELTDWLGRYMGQL
jgi:flagellar biosynthetic protein FliR